MDMREFRDDVEIGTSDCLPLLAIFRRFSNLGRFGRLLVLPGTHFLTKVRRVCSPGEHVRAAASAASPRSIQVWPTQAPIAPPPVRSSSLWWCSDAWAKADNGYMSCVQKAIKTLDNGASAAPKPCFLS